MSDSSLMRSVIVLAILSIAATTLGAQSKPTALEASHTRQAAGTAMETAVGDQPSPALQQRNPRYQLCRGDVMDLEFPFTPEFNQTATVQPDGYITLRGLGDLHVECQTIPELTRKLRQAYSKILHEQAISIVLKDFDN